MNRHEQYERHRAYIASEGLDQLIDFSENAEYLEGIFDAVSGRSAIPFPPEPDDLVRLHQLLRRRHSFTVLEFGVGFSTVIIADALDKNRRDWEGLPDAPLLRNRFMFQGFSVDASPQWIAATRDRIPDRLRQYINFYISECEIGTHQGLLCHFYCSLPNVIPDFIYLDGPFPATDVQGTIHGLNFQCPERTVMAADLLLMESTLLPGAFILVDGRTNNARFLARHFTRQWAVNWDREGDRTTFELVEERLGRLNRLGMDFFQPQRPRDAWESKEAYLRDVGP